jgi:hypothetical protein
MFKINNFSIVPKYIIFLLDLGATVTALFIAILIQQNVALATTNWPHVLNATFLLQRGCHGGRRKNFSAFTASGFGSHDLRPNRHFGRRAC